MSVLSPDASDIGDQVLCHRVKECCKHLHSNVQKWKELSSKGFDVINQIVNLTIQLKYTQDTTNYGSLHTSLPLLSNKLGSKAISDRENLFLQLREIRDNLLQVVEKMGSLVGNLRSVVDLSLVRDRAKKPLFITLPPSMFGVYSEELYRAYSQELSTRESIIKDLLTQEDRDTLTVYLSCWLQEPYITTNVNDNLEVLLFECGLHTNRNPKS